MKKSLNKFNNLKPNTSRKCDPKIHICLEVSCDVAKKFICGKLDNATGSSSVFIIFENKLYILLWWTSNESLVRL